MKMENENLKKAMDLFLEQLNQNLDAEELIISNVKALKKEFKLENSCLLIHSLGVIDVKFETKPKFDESILEEEVIYFTKYDEVEYNRLILDEKYLYVYQIDSSCLLTIVSKDLQDDVLLSDSFISFMKLMFSTCKVMYLKELNYKTNLIHHSIFHKETKNQHMGKQN